MEEKTPYAELSALARVEAHRKQAHRPPYYVHKWWARRTGSVFRGLALDVLLDSGEDVMEAYYRAHNFRDIVALDPFMGGGTGVGELLRLGCKVVGCDINPVAWFLVSQAMREVDEDALAASFSQIESRVGHRISEMYRTTCAGCDQQVDAQYTGWVKQVACTKCGRMCDLKRSQVVMADFQHEGAGLVECGRCSELWRVRSVHARVRCPCCSHRLVPARRRTHPAAFRCDSCGREERIITAIEAAGKPPVHRMRFLDVQCPRCGRRHQRPTHADISRYDEIERKVRRNFSNLWVPREPIPEGHNTDQLRRYGYRHWHELFSARQLRGLDLLFRAIGRIQDGPIRELLTLHASSTLEFNSMLCSAKGLGTGAIRHAFAHHALIPAKEPLEAHLWGVASPSSLGSSGGFKPLYERRVLGARAWARRPTESRLGFSARVEKVAIAGERLGARLASDFSELLRGDADLLCLNQSSEALPQIPDHSVDLVITDPPYADSVMYSELSDYFYVWLRRALPAHPAFDRPLVDDRREAVHNPRRGRDSDFYTGVIGAVFAECARVLKPDGRLAFTFHHSGEVAWRSLKDALAHARLVVERYWPVFAEMESGTHLHGKSGASGHLDIVFVCGRPDEVRVSAIQESVAEMGERLAEAELPLVAADHRALLKASRLQRATWSGLLSGQASRAGEGVGGIPS